VLIGDIAIRLEELLREKSAGLGCIIENMQIMPDHVHVFIKSPPIHAPHFIVGQLKGYTSHELREEFPSLKSRLPTLWTRSYYIESVGHISEDSVKKYIDEQKGK